MRKTKNYISIGRAEQNEMSGNHLIESSQLLENNKPFMFKFEDGTEVLINHDTILSYVSCHQDAWRMGCWVTDKDDNKKFVPLSYVLIPDEFILRNAA